MSPIFKPFRDLTHEDVLTDLHIHSTWTDGKAGVREICERAEELGLGRIGFTDHVRKGSTYCKAYVEEIQRLAPEFDFQLLAGFEAKVIDETGGLDISEDCRAMADFVVGSVHSIPMDGGFQRPETFSPEELEEAEHRLGLALARNAQAHVLAHAGGMSLSLHGCFDQGRMEDIIQACSESGTAFEINSRYHGSLLPWLLDTLQRHNPLVSLGSDAHDIARVGHCAQLLSSLRKF
jgi:putative hydrolase